MKRKFTPIPEALKLILKASKPLPPELGSLGNAASRILARHVRATSDRPAFNRSAVDGYALSTIHLPSYQLLPKEYPAGSGKPGKLSPDQCLRVYTGSALPSNCCIVLPQELVEMDGITLRALHWPEDSFIRCRGEDARRNSILIPAGTQLGAPELAILAQEGVTSPRIHQQVQCVHLIMGKELVEPSRKPAPGQIRDSNSALVAGLLQHPTLQLTAQKRTGDQPTAALAFLRSTKAKQASVLLISGGAGPGDHDWGRHLIQELGFKVLFDGVNIRPGKPLIAARKKSQTLFVLPGNPVSHWVTWHLFITPLLRKLSGQNPDPVQVRAKLLSTWKHSKDSREVWWPGTFSYQNGLPVVYPLPLQSSGDSSRLCHADCLIHFPRDKECFQAGEESSIILCSNP